MIFVETKHITVDKIITGGEGLGYDDGKAHFIPGALPGEIVEVEIVQTKKSFNRCRVITIIKKSDLRIPPFCKYYNECGGCTLQHTSYKNQLNIKKDLIKDIFKRNGKIELGDFFISPSIDKGYRNRVQFHIDGSIRGFKKGKSGQIINIESCPVLNNGLNKFLADGILVNEDRVTVFSSDQDYFIGGVDNECSANIKGREIYFNPKGFFQSNISLVPELIDMVNSYVVGSSVMDLYCGVGLFSSFLPESVTDIVAVELDSRVEPFIKRNIGDRNYKFYSLSLEAYLKRGLQKKNKIDTIIVDPPRKGLSDSVRKFLIKSGVKRVIYVSCDPVTMARDIKDLTESSYTLSYYQAFDFYPHTPHIESLGILDLE